VIDRLVHVALRIVPEQLPPARPHLRFTEEGRRVREVLSYARRGSRLTPSQQEAWDAHHDTWVIPDEAVDSPDFSLASWFGREAPVIVEIGSGIGEATAALARRRPECDILAFEVWRPGVAHTLGLLAEAGIGNVRLLGVDAVWAMEHLFAPGSVEELWTFFPDPWPKKRHHKRRLVSPEFAALVGSRLRAGGLWRLATDWEQYAEQMQSVLDAEPGLTGGRTERWADRPVTKFERKGIAAGRTIVDLTYVRRAGTAGGPTSRTSRR
jgi:tRNA (guanine-N7-)-methyltransferase